MVEEVSRMAKKANKLTESERHVKGGNDEPSESPIRIKDFDACPFSSFAV